MAIIDSLTGVPKQAVHADERTTASQHKGVATEIKNADKSKKGKRRSVGDRPKRDDGRAARRQRASSMICKFAGSHWVEAQRTKWVLDMVVAIDGEYFHTIHDQRARIAALEEELQRVYAVSAESDTTSLRKIQLLEDGLEKVGKELAEANQRVVASETRVRGMNEALETAERAAAAAANECVHLHRAVLSVSETGSRVRKSLATRADQLREGFLRTRCALRQQTKASRHRAVDVGRIMMEHQRRSGPRVLTRTFRLNLDAATILVWTINDVLQLVFHSPKQEADAASVVLLVMLHVCLLMRTHLPRNTD